MGAAEFLLLNQNWRGADDMDAFLPRAPYEYGDVKAGGRFSGGTLVAALKAIDIGSPEGEPTPLAKRAADLFASADVKSRLHSDMLHYLWVQYAMTGGPWAALVQAGSFDAFLLCADESISGSCEECFGTMSTPSDALLMPSATRLRSRHSTMTSLPRGVVLGLNARNGEPC